MINELMLLEKGLTDNNIQIEQKSSFIKRIKPERGFIFYLDPISNTITDVEFIDAKKMSLLWKVAHNNHKSFPITNFTEPFYTVSKIDNKDFADVLEMVISNNTVLDFLKYDFNLYDFNLNYGKKQIKRFTNLFYTYPCELRKYLKKDTSYFKKSIDIILNLFDDITKIEVTIKTILNQCVKVVCLNCFNGAIPNYKAIIDILFGKYNKKKGVFENPKYQIGICVQNQKDKIFHESRKSVNQALLSKSNSKKEGICALTGEKIALISKTFPELTLPGVGNTKLFAKNKDAPALFRYGMIGASAFSVSENKMNELATNLAYITSPEIKNKTWCTIGEGNLLISWLSGKAVSKCNDTVKNAMTHFFKNLGIDKESIINYEIETRKIINFIKDPTNSFTSDVNQHILVLTKADVGNNKVILNTTMNLKSIVENMVIWVDAVDNAIPFKLLIKFNKKEGFIPISPYTPSPISIMYLLQRRYKRDGNYFSVNSNTSIKDIFSILIKSPIDNKIIEHKILHELLQNTTNLLINIRETQIKALVLNEIKKDTTNIMSKYKTEARLNVLVSISLIEILLTRLNNGERRYKMEAMFYLGKYLAKMDELHLQYAIHERNGSIPSKLVGYSVITLARRNPLLALSTLSAKFGVYQNWAKVYYARTKDSKVGMLLAQIGNLTEKIIIDDFTTQTTDEDKALLVLGYQSWEKKKGENK